MRAITLILMYISELSLVSGDYDCLCNYNVEKAVYSGPNANGQPVGFMYEFDCKPLTVQQTVNNMYTIQYEKQVGYVTMDQKVQIQTCPGQPSATDLIPSSTTTSTVRPTTKTTTSTVRPTTQTTTSTVRPTTQTTMSTVRPTTQTTTSTVRQTTQTTTSTARPTTHTTASAVRPTTQTTTSTAKPTTQTTTSTTRPTTQTSTSTVKPTTHTTTSTVKPTTQTTTSTVKPTTQTTTSTVKPTTQTTTSTVKPTTQTTTSTTRPTTKTTTPSKRTTTQATTKPRSTTSTPLPTTFIYWTISVNVTGTPYQYVGIGYNILKGRPDAITDPGYLTSQRIFQLTRNSTSVREALYEKQTPCKPRTDTVLLYGSKAYQDELKGIVRPSLSHNSNLLGSAFTQSSPFESMRQSLNTGNNVYIDKIRTCSYGSVRYLSENADKENFAITREFARDVCALPETVGTNSSVKYMRFLDKWGTSIVTRVQVGTKSIDRFQTTPVEVFQHVEQTDSGLLKQSGAYKGFPSSVLINTHDYANSKAALTTFGARQSTSAGSAYRQTPISAELVPISDALNWAYWKPVAGELVAEGICSDSVFTHHMAKYLQGITMALNQYVAFKETEFGHGQQALVDRPAVQVPVTWPAGTYGLMKAASGCPAGNSLWREGWRKFDTEDTSSHNSFTPGIQNYLSGEFYSNDIVNRFCMKTSIHSISGSQFDQKWPKGSYCLLKKGSCPSGFGSGYIFWDDEDITNHNSEGGVLPDGTYDKNTKMYYCCRNDGSLSTKIILPTDRPFVLMRYGRTCQMVHGMSVREIYVRWDDEDLFNKDKTGGMHPLDDGGSKDHKIHFCYYQSAFGPSLIG